MTPEEAARVRPGDTLVYGQLGQLHEVLEVGRWRDTQEPAFRTRCDISTGWVHHRVLRFEDGDFGHAGDPARAREAKSEMEWLFKATEKRYGPKAGTPR